MALQDLTLQNSLKHTKFQRVPKLVSLIEMLTETSSGFMITICERLLLGDYILSLDTRHSLHMISLHLLTIP